MNTLRGKWAIENSVERMPEIGKSQGTQTSGEEGGKEQGDVSIC